MRSAFPIVAAFALAATSPPASDALRILRTSVENAMGTQAPEWTMTRSTIEDNRLEQSWSHELERLSIRCAEYASAAAATEALDGAMPAEAGEPVNEVGDAARVSPPSDSDVRTAIYFRRAAFACDVVVPSVQSAKRFAGLVVQEIDGLRNGKAGKERPRGSVPDYRVRIALVTMSPSSIEVPVGSRVTFVNDDAHRPHDMTSACPEIDGIGRLEPGMAGRTAIFTSPKVCTYHDRLQPTNPFRRGRIVVR